MNPIDRNKIEIFDRIKIDPRYQDSIDPKMPLPEPFCENQQGVKAIILGADPSHPPQNAKTLIKVFGLEDKDSPYFLGIRKNLKNLDLDLSNIYVQNLCPNYFIEVTDKNDFYIEVAKNYWVDLLKEELDALFHKEVPVLVTAWKTLVSVAPDSIRLKNHKSEIYKQSIIFNDNALGRPVVAFFRGGRNKGYSSYYDLMIPEYSSYKEKLRSLIWI